MCACVCVRAFQLQFCRLLCSVYLLSLLSNQKVARCSVIHPSDHSFFPSIFIFAHFQTEIGQQLQLYILKIRFFRFYKLFSSHRIFIFSLALHLSISLFGWLGLNLFGIYFTNTNTTAITMHNEQDKKYILEFILCHYLLFALMQYFCAGLFIFVPKFELCSIVCTSVRLMS